MFDVVIVGGGVAGLSAALVLGRSRRRTLVLDAGQARNAPAPLAHSFITHDGTPPLEILRTAREQLRPYTSVELRQETVIDAQRKDEGIELSLSNGELVRCRKLLLSHGVVDELPEIEGFQELWGKSVVHCPYCFGWELRDQPVALYGAGQTGIELVQMLLGWSRDLVLCTDGPADFTNEQRNQLVRHGVAVREERIARLEGTQGVLERIVFSDGSSVPRRAIFLHPAQQLRCDLAVRLGCERAESELIQVDEWGQTSVTGVYAAGDITTPVQQLIRAAASGATAAMGINHALLEEDFN